MTTELSVEVGGFSSKGVKNVNQDAFAAQIPKGNALKHKGVVTAIADGVSSSERSQEASQVSVTQFIADYYSTPDIWSVPQSGARVITALNSWLFNQNRGLKHDALVCTFSAVIIKSCSAYVFHVGDSRIYRKDKQGMQAVTRDHVLSARDQNILVRALGIDSHLEVDFQKIDDLKQGDIFLLSTDGFHDFISNNEIDQAIEQCDTLELASEKLVQKALENGSDDNVSCVILRINQLPQEDINEAHRHINRLAIPPVLKIGQSLEGYKVCRILFSGTRSHVYVVEDAKGKQYALKAPSDYFNDDDVYLEGFLREEWIGKRLNHSHIMKVFPRAEGSRFMYHLCEFLDGQSLRQWMVDNPKPTLEQVRQIINEVCTGLRHFQRNGMVHRDLKPENVIIDRFGQIKIIDFGTVRVEGLDEVKSPIANDVPVGSVDYIAPEYLVNRQDSRVGDFRSDMYSLAVMAYEMLTGTLPYKLDDLRNNIPNSFGKWRYDSMTTLRPDLPKWIDLAIHKACEPNPTNRCQAFSEFLTDLKKPNSSLLNSHEQQPLMQRDPLRFWQVISFSLVLVNIATVIYFLN